MEDKRFDLGDQRR